MPGFVASSASGLLLMKSSWTKHFANYAILRTRARTQPTAHFGKATGPVYAHEAVMLTFFMTVSVYAICYLLIRIAGGSSFVLPHESRLLFEEDWVPNRQSVARAFEQLYGESAVARER